MRLHVKDLATGKTRSIDVHRVIDEAKAARSKVMSELFRRLWAGLTGNAPQGARIGGHRAA